VDNLCFTCDWIIDLEGIPHIAKLLENSNELNCKLNIDKFILPNGLQVIRFIMYAPSKSVSESFITKAKESTTFSEWVPANREIYPESAQGMEFWDWSILHSFLDELYGSSLENSSVQKNQ
jgi:hypothetical protein